MKKEYQKPQMMVENFMLSDYIASCSDIINFSNQCSGNKLSQDMEQIIGNYLFDGCFVDSATCTTVYTSEEFEDLTGVCYHTPTGTMSVFSS